MCPEVFTWDGEKAVAYTVPDSESERAACWKAAKSCPTDAILIE
jgi:ferredoxin